MEQRHGLPRPRHSYVHVPQPGRRGVLVYNGQIPNGAAAAGVHPGGISMGYGAGYGAGFGAFQGGANFYPGVYGSLFHTRPHYYGPNTYRSTYAKGYWNYPSSYYNFPSYSYLSPYASYGGGSGMFANYYFPYQRSYYTPGFAAPGYSYAYQTMAPAVAIANPQIPVAACAPTPLSMNNSPAHPSATPPRSAVQHQNQVEAHRRGAYNPHYIKPANARPEDQFWCQEVTGEWHLRSYYQIENECHPGEWRMNPDYGFLSFHRV